jgi:hypothetical protein
MRLIKYCMLHVQGYSGSLARLRQVCRGRSAKTSVSSAAKQSDWVWLVAPVSFGSWSTKLLLYPRFTTANFCHNHKSTLNSFTMASKSFVRTLRAASKQKIPSGSLQKRGFSSALAARPAVAAPRAAFVAPVVQQTRGVKTIDFAGTSETVYGEHDLSKRWTQADVVQSVRTGPERSSM